VVSDHGLNWGVESTLVIGSELPNQDLGYPGTLLHSDGHLTTVYYAQDSNGITCIQSTILPQFCKVMPGLMFDGMKTVAKICD
jgi:hypothetical protein